MNYYTVIPSPIGPLTLVAEEEALTGVYLMDADRRPIDRAGFGERIEPGTDPVIAAARQQLEEYFAGRRSSFEVPLNPGGTEFSRRVWQQLTTVPYGETRSYGEIAAALGNPDLARAVGAANGKNPISIIIPCHRLVGSTGKLTGYAAGHERKRTLLLLENPGWVEVRVRERQGRESC